MKAAAKDRGAVLKIEFNEFDAAKQISQIEKLISQGIDVLIIAPVALEGYTSLIEKAHEAGVKVVDYEELLRNADLAPNDAAAGAAIQGYHFNNPCNNLHPLPTPYKILDITG